MFSNPVKNQSSLSPFTSYMEDAGTKTQRYETHDNGGRPFVVELTLVDDAFYNVQVFKNVYDNATDTYNQETNPLITFEGVQVWIGYSPDCKTTRYSGGYGPKFDGNSFLICDDAEALKYTFIGESIFSFHASMPIVAYHSPVGNSDVPYPYAIDCEGHFYLMIENVEMHPPNGQSFDTDPDRFCPYDRYYGHDKVRCMPEQIDYDNGDPNGPFWVNANTRLRDIPNLEATRFYQSVGRKHKPTSTTYTVEQVEQMQANANLAAGSFVPLSNMRIICPRTF